MHDELVLAHAPLVPTALLPLSLTPTRVHLAHRTYSRQRSRAGSMLLDDNGLEWVEEEQHLRRDLFRARAYEPKQRGLNKSIRSSIAVGTCTSLISARHTFSLDRRRARRRPCCERLRVLLVCMTSPSASKCTGGMLADLHSPLARSQPPSQNSSFAVSSSLLTRGATGSTAGTETGTGAAAGCARGRG
jgi:hypothetical protein